MRVGQQDAAGLEHRQELRLSGLGKGGEEGVGALGDALLQHRRVVRHRSHVLRTTATFRCCLRFSLIARPHSTGGHW